MSDYSVHVMRSDDVVDQPYHVTIKDAGNHETIFWTENYKMKSWAMETASRIATALGCELVDETTAETEI